MAKDETILKVLIASPSDVKEERSELEKIIEDISRISSKERNIRLEPLTWEKDSYPDIGKNAQDVINKQFKDEYDIFIGVFWTRFGTPTKEACSGTEEEFDRAYNRFIKNSGLIKIMIYFKTKGPDDLNSFDIDQFKLVKEFKKRIEQKGVYYKNFNSLNDFRRNIRNDLESHLIEWGKTWGFLDMNKNNNSEIEKKEDDFFSNDDGGIDIYEKGMSEGIKLKESLIRLKNVIKGHLELLKEFNEMSKNEKKISNSNIKTIKRLSNKMADGMDKFKSQIETEIPIIQKKSEIFFNALKHIIFFINEGQNSNLESIKQYLELIKNLEKGFESDIPKIKSFIEAIKKYPRFTSKFNRSKKNLESTLKKLINCIQNVLNSAKYNEKGLEDLLNKLKTEPRTAAAYIEIRLFVNSYIIFLQNLFRYSVNEPEPKTLEGLLTVESGEKIIINLDLNAKPLIIPERSMSQYLYETAKDISEKGDKILDRFGEHIDSKIYKYIHNVIESSLIKSLKELLLNSVNYCKTEGIPKPMILSAHLTQLDKEKFKSLLSLYKWCKRTFDEIGTKFDLPELIEYKTIENKERILHYRKDPEVLKKEIELWNNYQNLKLSKDKYKEILNGK